MDNNEQTLIQKWLRLFGAKKLPDQIAPKRRGVRIRNTMYEDPLEGVENPFLEDDNDVKQDSDKVEKFL